MTETDSRARGFERTDERAKRVAHIRELMLAGEWVRGRTGRELAAEWKLAYSTVREDAARAASDIRSGMPDEQVAAMVEADLETIVRIAVETGDVKGAVAALRLRLEARGMLKQRVEVSVEQHDMGTLARDTLAAIVATPELHPLLREAYERAFGGAVLTSGTEVD